jgi:threonine/homoserine/homoserine lactone efflux protein
MLYILSVLFWGWLVSFLGQLPLGTMSVTTTQIAVEENYRNAWKYLTGVVLIEVIYLRLVLSGVNWITEHKLFYDIFGWIAVVLFLVLSVVSFVSAYKHKEGKKTLILDNKLSRFFLGITMSAANAAQIPFWFIWSTYVINLNGMQRNSSDYNLFTVGAGMGTIAGLALYMYGGKFLINKTKNGSKKLSIVMGIIFIIAAIAQCYRMILGNTIK